MFEIFRIKQWYKNLVIFLPILFSGEIANQQALQLTILGFFALCLMSSANYVINDIVDRKTDKKTGHKTNIIAQGKFKVSAAIVVACVLFAGSYLLALNISEVFSFFVVGLFIGGSLYNFWLKHEVFADILLISCLFVLRATSGAFVITENFEPFVWISPWLLVCTFFLAFFMVSAKRYNESHTADHNFRKTLKEYSGPVTTILMMTSVSLLLISYTMYSFLGEYPNLIFTLPFAFYVILRYQYLVFRKDSVVDPMSALKDKRLFFTALLWIIFVVNIIYLHV